MLDGHWTLDMDGGCGLKDSREGVGVWVGYGALSGVEIYALCQKLCSPRLSVCGVRLSICLSVRLSVFLSVCLS